jgi:hypothetical protein
MGVPYPTIPHVHNEDIETDKRRLGITVFGVELGDFTYCRCCFNLLAWQGVISGGSNNDELDGCCSGRNM